MVKIKTFSSQFEPFHITKQLEALDNQVNEFIASNGVAEVVSVSDATTHVEGGTMGIIRVLAYKAT